MPAAGRDKRDRSISEGKSMARVCMHTGQDTNLREEGAEDVGLGALRLAVLRRAPPLLVKPGADRREQRHTHPPAVDVVSNPYPVPVDVPIDRERPGESAEVHERRIVEHAARLVNDPSDLFSLHALRSAIEVGQEHAAWRGGVDVSRRYREQAVRETLKSEREMSRRRAEFRGYEVHEVRHRAAGIVAAEEQVHLGMRGRIGGQSKDHRSRL